MIETGTAYRARPRCSRCGWTGVWRMSRSEDSAQHKAAADLYGHEQLWHPEPDPVEALA